MNCVAKKHSTPATRPMINAPIGPTKPDAGVIVPKPATMPVTMPRTLGLPNLSHSLVIHAVAPAAAPTRVTSIAIPADELAETALPALKPNQPTHSNEAPITVIVTLCGGIAVVGKPVRLPMTSAATSAATPALTCTTAPPAKSRKPRMYSQPSGAHTQCAMGRYTTTSQRIENHSIAENRVRSANPPTISAGVMIANVSWNIANTVSGIIGATLCVLSSSTPRIHSFDNPPTQEPPSPNASEYPNKTQINEMTQHNAKHCINTESTLRVRTRPP